MIRVHSRLLVPVAVAAAAATWGLTAGYGIHGQAAASSEAQARGGPTIWSAGVEDGSLAGWEEGGGGGPFNSGGATTTATDAIARTGAWSAELSLPAGSGGARLFRWAEPRAHRDLYYENWYYFPQAFTLVGSEGAFLDFFQFKSVSEDGAQNDPIWFLNVHNREDGSMVPELVWWHRTLEGPHQGENGYRTYVNDLATLPVGRWFKVTARLRQSNAFDGRLSVWLDSNLIFDQRGVRTGYQNCTYNSWCVDQHWSVNLYSDGLVPSPAVVYVDDARIREVTLCRS
jgi:hypothetical protein